MTFYAGLSREDIRLSSDLRRRIWTSLACLSITISSSLMLSAPNLMFCRRHRGRVVIAAVAVVAATPKKVMVAKAVAATER